MSSIAENLDRVRGEIAAACGAAGRDEKGIRLMAVSKTHPPEALAEAYRAGQRLFGENRVQEWEGKREGLSGLDGLEMHLIGPLQSNKTGKAAGLFDAVDSVDSLKIAQRLSDARAAAGLGVLPVLIEVKLSHEEAKHGLAPEELPALLDGIAELSHVEARGLMTVPPLDEDLEVARRCFRKLRELRDVHVEVHDRLVELSMGMSHDFAVAIEEGSTCVRVGTAIFGKREYPA